MIVEIKETNGFMSFDRICENATGSIVLSNYGKYFMIVEMDGGANASGGSGKGLLALYGNFIVFKNMSGYTFRLILQSSETKLIVEKI